MMNPFVTESIAQERREKLAQEAQAERQRRQAASRQHATHVDIEWEEWDAEPHAKRRPGLWGVIRHALGIFM